MIIVRSPLRITLGGGGTDLPSYYRDHDGFLIAAAMAMGGDSVTSASGVPILLAPAGVSLWIKART